MFKKLLKSSILFGFMGVCTLSYAQLQKSKFSPQESANLLNPNSTENFIASKKEIGNEKAVCGWDIIEYTEAKNLHPTGSYSGWNVMSATGYISGIGQDFYSDGEVIIDRVWFLAQASAPGLTVTVDIYDTIGLAGTASVVAPTAFGWTQAILPAPIVVDGPYMILITNPSTTNIVVFASNGNAQNSGRGEDLAVVTFNGNLYGAMDFFGLNSIAFDADFIITPRVAYEFVSDFTINSTPECAGSDIQLTNTSSPIVENRLYNQKAFDNYFYGDSDDTYTWTLADGSTVNTKNATTTHSTAGTYNVTLDISYEAWYHTCEETKSETVEFLSQDDAAFNYSVSTVCSGSSDITPSSVATAGGTFSATGALIIDATTGEIDVTNSPVGSYVITYTTNGTCPSSSTQNLEIISSPDASFSYAVDEFCSNDANPSPVFTTGSAGTFSSASGLSINASTGVINLSASTPDTYTITNEVSISGCAVVSETFDVTINAAPSVSANADNTEICAGEEVILTGSGADSYDWDNSVTDGVAFEPAVGTVTYTVTGTDANGCENTATVNVTVNALPTVSGGADLSVCDGDQITLSGSGADTYDWDNGVLDGVAFTQTAGTTETYTVTGTDANGCENTATVDVTVNEIPTVTLDPLGIVCDNAGDITLAGGNPGGGTYSGTGVSGGIFDPAAAGAGIHTITYTVEENGCEGVATASIEVDACVGIESGNVETLSIFPNPASSELNVVFENVSGADATVVLTTTDGKIVYQSSAKAMSLFNEKINVADFANGVYFINIKSETTSLVQRVVLN